MTSLFQELSYMTVAVTERFLETSNDVVAEAPVEDGRNLIDGELVMFRRPKRSPEQAVEALLSLPGTGARFLTFDLSNDPSSPVQLAAWIQEFKRLYWEKLSKDGLAFKPLSFIVFADRFTYADKVPLLEAGAILFDRSLPGNAHCQTTEQLLQWLDRNRQTESQQQSLRPRPQPPADGISLEDLEALNSYPHGMTKERLRSILAAFDTQ